MRNVDDPGAGRRAMPRSLAKSAAVSPAESDAVGSSRISTRAFDRKRARDFHELLLSHAQRADARPHIADFRQAKLVPQRFRFRENAPAVQQAEARRFASKKDVFRNAEIWRERKFLMDEPNAEPIRVGHIADGRRGRRSTRISPASGA